MTRTLSNVVSLPSSAKLSQVGEINTVLINAFQKRVFPHVDPILTDLIQHLVKLSEAGHNNAQIMQFIEARQGLIRSESEIIECFRMEVLKHFHDFEEEDNTNTSISLDELSLVDNGDLEKKLALQSAARQLSMSDHLQYFNNIQNRLSGLIHFEPENNPLGAQKICESFAQALFPAQLEPELTQELLLQFAVKIKPAVMELWHEVDNYLDSIGLEISKPATKIAEIPEDEPFSKSKHIQELSAGNSRDAVPQNKQEAPALDTSQKTEDSSHIWNEAFMNELANRLLSRVEGLLNAPSEAPDASVSCDANLFASVELASTLTSIQEELSSQNASIFSLAESIKGALKDKGVKQKLSPRHRDLINMVGMLFEFILDDHELPDEVKKLIGLLQIPVLKLTLLEESFLTDRHHAARELLNDMTSAGMRTTLEPETEKPVIELIEDTIKYIIKHFTENPDIFSSCHKNFNEKLLKIRGSIEQNQTTTEPNQTESAVHEEVVITEAIVPEAETGEVNSEFQLIICNLISTRQYTVPESMEKLVNDVWSDILESALSNSESADVSWFDAINTLDILLWNLQPEHRDSVSAQDCLLLKTMLLDYLNKTGHDPFIVVEWMNDLDALISIPIEFPREEVISVSPEDSTAEEVHPEPDTEEIILQSQRLDDSDLELPEVVDNVSEDDEVSDKNTLDEHTGAQLIVGQWVEFIGKQDQHFRCRLSSINAVTHRYTFVNSSGMKVAEMSGYALKSGIENERICIIEDTQFFDKALHAVMNKFLKF
ncbi:DUF1631 family protein [Endozoicomonas sp. 8E]|uniref:DUF1631 family protein n=1 Tax=Endozoicomonas sp. 8E TaxID=3035692 RepID=UPI00293941A3|nr:DUF1631 family protein [Endozoicomonas sp. 8E]WOG29329.1 DUF1631 family protein [Endozoicomonas sp. 8E]